MVCVRYRNVRRTFRQQTHHVRGVLGANEPRALAADQRDRAARLREHRRRARAMYVLPQERIEPPRPAATGFMRDLFPRLACNRIGDKDVVASLRRRKTEARQRPFQSRIDAMWSVNRLLARAGLAFGNAFRRENRRIDDDARTNTLAVARGNEDRDMPAE